MEDIDFVYRDYNTPNDPSSGDSEPEKPRIRRLLKSIAGGFAAVGDYRGTWDDETDYIRTDLVEFGGSIWYSLIDNTNVTPTEGVTWTVFLPGVTAADGSITAAQLSGIPADVLAMGLKLNMQTNGDYTIYVDPTGDDATGDGTIGAPFATPQRAWDSLPWLVKDKVVIQIANGTYAASSRPAASLDRPALIYCDQKKMGRRTDGPGGVMTGSVTFYGETKAGVILQPGSGDGYVRGIYVTGHVGSVAFAGFTIDAQTGAEAGIVAHRGSYVHTNNIDIDGNGLMTFGIIGEAGGILEGLGMDVHDCAIGVQSYQGCTVQLSLASHIHDCSSLGINIPNGGYVGLTTGSICDSNITMQAGGKFDCTGVISSRVTINGTMSLRGGAWSASFCDVTGNITTYPGAELNLGAFGWSAAWTDYGADIYAPGAKSYVAPATQSTVAVPLQFLGGTRNLAPDATFQIVDSSGTEVSESLGTGTVSIPGNNQTFATPIRGIVNTVVLTSTANRTGIIIPNVASGRSAVPVVPAGTVLYILGGSSFTQQLVPGSSGDFGSLSAGILIGTATGAYMGVICVMGVNGLWRVAPLGPVR